MKQMLVDGNTSYLPEEIMTEIFKRLPVKSLIRFQSVSKHWRNLIKSPSFISEHLHHSTSQNPCLLFQHSYEFHEPLCLRLLDYEMQVRRVHNTPSSSTDFHSSYIHIINSANGLLCVSMNDRFPSSLSLWNPAIREVKHVPRTINPIHLKCHCTEGFGYSTILNDYKIVRIYREVLGVISGAEMYSLSTNSWREIKLGNLQGTHHFLHHNTVSANGSIFWCGRNSGLDDNNVIVSYDMAREVFSIIPFGKSFFTNKLTVYDDKLAILSHNKQIDLWVLEKIVDSSVEKWSWTKKYTSSLYPRASTSLATIWKNQIVYIVRKQQNDEPNIAGLYLLDVTTNKVKIFVVPELENGAYFVFNHVESLVPVGNFHIR